jgi:hypothetical protein
VLDQAAAQHATGIMDGTSIYYADGVLSPLGPRYSLDYAIEAADGNYVDPADTDVRKGVSVGVSPRVGTLVGIVDSAGTQHDYGTCSSTQAWAIDGIIHTSGTAADSGIITSGGGYYATGILASANAYYSYGTLSLAGAYNATGVIYGTGDYATEASRNNATATATEILTGYSVTLLGSTTNGSATTTMTTSSTPTCGQSPTDSVQPETYRACWRQTQHMSRWRTRGTTTMER